MMNAEKIILSAIPNATEGLIEHIIWARTPYPMGIVTPKSLYKAASRWNRARVANKELCDFCDKLAVSKHLCDVCSKAIRPKVSE